MNVSDDHKPDEKHDPKKASKNTVLKAVVYVLLKVFFVCLVYFLQKGKNGEKKRN
jgi:hypothetical protein